MFQSIILSKKQQQMFEFDTQNNYYTENNDTKVSQNDNTKKKTQTYTTIDDPN